MNVSAELRPQLLYRMDGSNARFATWRLAEGHETLALFTTADTARQYREGLGDVSGWKVLQPPHDKLLEILHACRSAGILYAALDPLTGSAKTLFNIPRVLASAEGNALDSERGGNF